MSLFDKIANFFKGKSSDKEQEPSHSDCSHKTETSEELSSLRVVDLRSLAKSRNLKGYTKLSKSELVNFLLQN
mgnify:CR=1 FL=1